MSHYDDPDDFMFRPKTDKKAFVRDTLARIGISLDDRGVLPAPPIDDLPRRDFNVGQVQREQMLEPPGSWPVSQTLARIMGYRPGVPKVDVCPTCKGTKGLESSGRFFDCPTCGGTGEAKPNG